MNMYMPLVSSLRHMSPAGAPADSHIAPMYKYNKAIRRNESPTHVASRTLQ